MDPVLILPILIPLQYQPAVEELLIVLEAPVSLVQRLANAQTLMALAEILLVTAEFVEIVFMPTACLVAQ